jgi:hypothetical protein
MIKTKLINKIGHILNGKFERKTWYSINKATFLRSYPENLFSLYQKIRKCSLAEHKSLIRL